MVDFLYFGEANVSQENLDSFLAVAEELQLKGLMGSGAEEEVEENKSHPKKKPQKQAQIKNFPQKEATDLFNLVDKVETSPTGEGTLAVTDDTVAADLDGTIKSIMMFSENKTKDGKERARICKVCGKEGELSATKRHIESHHITGVSHTCSICGKTSNTRHSFNRH